MSTEKIGFKEKVAYGCGDAASSMFWKLFTMYLMFYYTDVFGISAMAVGTMFMVARLWDAAFDPLVGIISDRTETRWGKFRPYLLWMALPFGLIGVLTFTAPSFGPRGLLLYAYVTYSAMMMVYSLINVPYGSLMGVMSADTNERLSLSTYRFFFAFTGSYVALGLVKPLAVFFGNLHHDSIPSVSKFGWQMAAAVIAGLAVALFLLTFAWTRERVKPMAESSSLSSDLKDLLKNAPWFILLGAGIMTIFFNSIRDGAAMYYFKYLLVEKGVFRLWRLTFAPSDFYLVWGQLMNILGVLIAQPIASKLGKKITYMGSMAVAAIFSAFFYGVDKTGMLRVFGLQTIISIAAGAVLPLLWSMYADTADYSEWKTGRRATGLVFSASSMSQKFGWAIGGSLVGFLLGYYGFHANVVQTDRALFGMRLMLSVFPAVGAALSALFMAIYPLSESKVQRITEDLSSRRATKE